MESLHTDLVLYIFGFLSPRSIRTLGCCARRYWRLCLKEKQRRQAISRARFLEVAQTTKNYLHLVYYAIREDQFDFNWLQLNHPGIIEVLRFHHLNGGTDFIPYIVGFQDRGKLYNLDFPYSQHLHQFISTLEIWNPPIISYMCFRMTKVKYTKAALQHAISYYNRNITICPNTYDRFYGSHIGKYTILSYYHKHLPQFFYEKLPELTISQRHWAALCVQDVRYNTKPGKYFKTKQDVIAYYQGYITSPTERAWVKRKLQSHRLVFIW